MGILGPVGAWRGARGAARAALAIVLLCWAALAFAQDDGSHAVGLEIVAGEDWTATGIEVRPGDTIAVVAADAAGPRGPMGPGGTDSRSEDVIDPQFPHAALIGRIGDGPIFLVGAKYEGKMDSTGPLRLRWNLLQGAYANAAPWVFPVEIVHPPAAVRVPDKKTDDSTKVSAAKAPVKARAPHRRPKGGGKARREAPPDSPPGFLAGLGSWLWWAVIALAAAAAAAVAVQRGSRARAVRRTRAMVGLSPSLDLAEGLCRGDDLPAEGPAASLRARLEPGASYFGEGSDYG
jgi:hypothetical protein